MVVRVIVIVVVCRRKDCDDSICGERDGFGVLFDGDCCGDSDAW